MINKYLVRDFVDGYDRTIDALVPRYRDMLRSIVSAIHFDKTDKLKIIELGCGTGNLTVLLAERFPDATIIGYDISPYMLEEAWKKLINCGSRISLKQADITLIGRFETKADIIVSSLFFHEIPESSRRKILKKIYHTLNKGGVLINGDYVSLGNRKNEDTFKKWFAHMIRCRLSQKDAIMELEMHRFEKHKKSDYFAIMREIGFKKLKVVWEHLNYCVYRGEKL